MHGQPGELIETINLGGRVYQIRRGPEPDALQCTEVYWKIGHRHNGAMQWDLDIYFTGITRVASDVEQLKQRLAEIKSADLEATMQAFRERNQP